jgi:GT2 family glycosyltransferase
MSNKNSQPDISICMVSLDCRDVLRNCLDSLSASLFPLTYEIIIVDNASTDGTLSELETYNFPQLLLLKNDKNVGFTKATNQAIEMSSGKYLLWLNTDTILSPDALRLLWQYLEENPEIGIAGPKVLNRDGTFQPQCRRGLPTPWASLAYFLRLDRIWPEHAAIGQYLLTYLPIDKTCQVTAVSGCCLMARREVWESIGPLDEEIFAFGEDLDWCVQARQAGWEVWYYPQSVIVHLKGLGGVHTKPYHKSWGMHKGMWVFYRKHLISKSPWIITVFVCLGIVTSLIFSIISIWLHNVMHVILHKGS